MNDELSYVLFKNNNSIICYGCLFEIIGEQKVEPAIQRIKKGIKRLFRKRIYDKDAVIGCIESTRFRSEISDGVIAVANDKNVSHASFLFSLYDYASLLSRSYKLTSGLNISLSNTLTAMEKTIAELRDNILEQYFFVLKNLKVDKKEYWMSFISEALSAASFAMIGGTPKKIEAVDKLGNGGSASGWIKEGVEKIWPWEARKVIIYKISIYAIDIYYRNVYSELHKQRSA